MNKNSIYEFPQNDPIERTPNELVDVLVVDEDSADETISPELEFDSAEENEISIEDDCGKNLAEKATKGYKYLLQQFIEDENLRESELDLFLEFLTLEKSALRLGKCKMTDMFI
jgi:hypothetical protein